MVSLLLTLHNLLRWLVVIAAVLALIRSFSGWLGNKAWTDADERAGILLAGSLDFQVLVGIILYIYPGTYTTMAFSNMSGAMQNEAVRFFAIEHILMMLVALALVHIGRSRAKKAVDDTRKHRQSAIFFGLGVLLVLFAIPWPFLDYGRPLLRFFGIAL